MTLLQQLYSLETAECFQLFNKLRGTFFIRLGVDLLTVTVLIRLIYYPIYRRADLFLTFFAFNLIIFLITFLLNQVQMSIGSAFGLFAVFSMLRYRTEGLSAKDMTYLFVGISVGLLSAIIKVQWDELGLINGMILLMVQLLEGNWLIRRELVKKVYYDRIGLIRPNRRFELVDDLQARTGLEIHRVEVQDVDLVKETAHIMIYYYQDCSGKERAKKQHEKINQYMVSLVE